MANTLDLRSSEALEFRREEMLRRLDQHRKKEVWDAPPPKGQYHIERPAPNGVAPYQVGGLEPIVNTSDLYDIDRNDAFVTVNSYDALVLNSKNLLIADIDFGNPRFNEHGGATEVQDVLKWIKRLKHLDRYLAHRYRSAFFELEHPRFAEQSYQVFRTAGGCRVICVSEPFPWDTDGWLALHFMRFLRADPQYMRLCHEQKCYRARLTPKPWRDRDGCGKTCRLVKYIRPQVTVDSPLHGQIRLHGEITRVVEYPICIEERYLA